MAQVYTLVLHNATGDLSNGETINLTGKVNKTKGGMFTGLVSACSAWYVSGTTVVDFSPFILTNMKIASDIETQNNNAPADIIFGTMSRPRILHEPMFVDNDRTVTSPVTNNSGLDMTGRVYVSIQGILWGCNDENTLEKFRELWTQYIIEELTSSNSEVDAASLAQRMLNRLKG